MATVRIRKGLRAIWEQGLKAYYGTDKSRRDGICLYESRAKPSAASTSLSSPNDSVFGGLAPLKNANAAGCPTLPR